jgi:hypothetical protein
VDTELIIIFVFNRKLRELTLLPFCY